MGLEAAVLGLTLLSGVTQAFGAYQQGKAQKEAAEYNAAVARQEKEAIRRSADIDIQRQKKYARSYKARQEALYSKAGVTLSGSPLEVISDTAAEFEYDQMITDYNAKLGISRAESQAKYEEFKGETYYKEGLVKAGTTLLSTGSNVGFRYLSLNR